MASPRLLLFGNPGAGKSALLDAIVHSAPALEARLVDQSDDLQHFHVKPAERNGAASDVTVLDCNGKSALEMLQAEEPFATAHPMRRPILDADAVALVVDVSASPKQRAEEFRQSARWLKNLHETRGRRTDIAELPVYVVLAKCDLLAKKDDTPEAWKNRIELAKRQYLDNFTKFLKQHQPGFGTLKLKVVATAIQQPEFADTKPAGPFGVAELFQECLHLATDFQQRRLTAQGRLQNVVVGVLGLIALLGLSVFFLVEFQPPPRGTTLDEKIQLAMPKPTATPVERLAGTLKKLEEKEQRLTEIEADAEFKLLPGEMQKDITRYHEELAQYLKLNQEAQTVLKLPHLAKNDADFKELEKSVRAFTLPDGYAKDWEDTRLGRRIKHVRGEFERLHAELTKEEAWIREQIEANKQLLKAGNRAYGKLLDQDPNAAEEARSWVRQYQTQLNARPPTPRDESVPGVSRLIYDDLGKFEPVKTAQKDWKTSRDDLTNISALIQKKLRSS